MTNDVVKSAARVLEMLEHFDSVRADSTVMDIARALDYPQSSTSVLVRSLVDLGYLQHGAKYRSYRPTPRVTLLGAWIEPTLSRKGSSTARTEVFRLGWSGSTGRFLQIPAASALL